MIDTIKKIMGKLKEYIYSNRLMATFILTCLINGCLIRFFTVGNYFAIKPILADLVFLFVITSFGYFIKPKHQFIYFLVWSIILTGLCVVNAIYYSNYISFASFSLLKTATELGGYGDAVSGILELKFFIYLWQIFALIFVHIQLKRKKYYDEEIAESNKVRFLNMIVVALITLGFFISMLTSTDISRLNKQWNRSSIVMEFGLYVYQANDALSSVKTQVNEMFGYDEAYKKFRDYYETREYEHKDNKYTNIFEGKNVLVIHGESLQGFTMNLKFNDVELTPNLNKWAREGMYFSNYYAQESVGNSSDSEFTSLTSLMPSSSGTVFMNYFRRDYETSLKLLKDKGYYTFSMHGNNASAWNRNVMYKYLGYDDFFAYKKDFEIDEKIGLGLSDKSFFRQAVEKIKVINEEKQNWYGTLVMLTNHTPFNDVDTFDYVVDYKTDEVDPETGEEIFEPWLSDTKMGNYLKSVHYADEALGELMTELEEAGLLDNTIIVLYGDHDCKLKQSEFRKLYNNEHYKEVLIDPENTIGTIDEFTYEINRKVPFIIWSKDILGTKYAKETNEVMGMIDMMPTLANMIGIKPKYALGNDIFNVSENIVVFPSGNWITNKMYYNAGKGTFRQLDLDATIDLDYIEKNNIYANNLIDISNGIITYDLIKAYEEYKETLN